MVIADGASGRASLMPLEYALQSVMFIAHLILGHLASMPKHIGASSTEVLGDNAI